MNDDLVVRSFLATWSTLASNSESIVICTVGIAMTLATRMATLQAHARQRAGYPSTCASAHNRVRGTDGDTHAAGRPGPGGRERPRLAAGRRAGGAVPDHHGPRQDPRTGRRRGARQGQVGRRVRLRRRGVPRHPQARVAVAARAARARGGRRDRQAGRARARPRRRRPGHLPLHLGRLRGVRGLPALQRAEAAARVSCSRRPA